MSLGAETTPGAREHTEEELAAPETKKQTGFAARVRDITSHGPTYAILTIISILWLIPAFGLLVSSFRSAATNSNEGWWTIFTNWDQFTIQPYLDLLQNDAIISAFWNTFYITIPTTILVVVIAAMAAYAFTFVDFKGRDIGFLVVVGLLVVPLQIGLIPIANLYGTIGIFGTITGVVIYHIAFGLPFAIFLMRNFFIGIPEELLEAARLDGASELRLFFRVVLPLGIPAVASLMIFQFLWTWNDLLIALVFADPSSQPITVAIQQQTRQFGTNIDIIAPGAFLSMIVPLVVFFAFQRYFAQGLLAGSGK
ncbi:MAG: carbohydrate ABC transporter permease [Nitriliruptorales bacterium]|nr:carbohydrate ABC transporter permease [Nitriliruptorales bacterium]